jgi:hypothetical protein
VGKREEDSCFSTFPLRSPAIPLNDALVPQSPATGARQSRTGHKPNLDERCQHERKFGEAKQYHGLPKGCRHLGIWRYAIQVYLTAIALDLKRLVWLLAGVPFKAKSRSWSRPRGVVRLEGEGVR